MTTFITIKDKLKMYTMQITLQVKLIYVKNIFLQIKDICIFNVLKI